jgi:hypothetical protein
MQDYEKITPFIYYVRGEALSHCHLSGISQVLHKLLLNRTVICIMGHFCYFMIQLTD